MSVIRETLHAACIYFIQLHPHRLRFNRCEIRHDDGISIFIDMFVGLGKSRASFIRRDIYMKSLTRDIIMIYGLQCSLLGVAFINMNVYLWSNELYLVHYYISWWDEVRWDDGSSDWLIGYTSTWTGINYGARFGKVVKIIWCHTLAKANWISWSNIDNSVIQSHLSLLMYEALGGNQRMMISDYRRESHCIQYIPAGVGSWFNIDSFLFGTSPFFTFQTR